MSEPVTKQDLQELEGRLQQDLRELKNEMIESMREMQTEVLRALLPPDKGATFSSRIS